jgi:hypothetical protein
MNEDRLLRNTAIFYGVATLLHSADHLRRGVTSVTPEVLWLGSVGTSVALIAIAMVILGPRRLGPVIAASTGFPMAFGIAMVHFLPTWSSFSDSFPDGRVTGISWVAAVLEVTGALAFGVVGVVELRRQARVSQPGARSLAGSAVR